MPRRRGPHLGEGVAGERGDGLGLRALRRDGNLPWLTYALLSDARIHRKHKRLYDAREQAVATLGKEVDKRRKKLAETIEYPLPKAKAKRGAKARSRR